jgi:hypothetical protein
VAKKKKPEAEKETAEKKANPIKIESYVRELKVALKREEIEERAERAAHLVAQRDLREEEIKEDMKRQKSALATIDGEIRSLSNQVRDKVAYRDVPCERRYIYDLRMVKEIRLDNGETLFERPMTEAELQRDLFDNAKPGDLDDEFSGDSEDEKEKEGESEAEEDDSEDAAE